METEKKMEMLCQIVEAVGPEKALELVQAELEKGKAAVQ